MSFAPGGKISHSYLCKMAGINARMESFEAEFPYAIDTRIQADGNNRKIIFGDSVDVMRVHRSHREKNPGILLIVR